MSYSVLDEVDVVAVVVLEALDEVLDDLLEDLWTSASISFSLTVDPMEEEVVVKELSL